MRERGSFCVWGGMVVYMIIYMYAIRESQKK